MTRLLVASLCVLLVAQWPSGASRRIAGSLSSWMYFACSVPEAQCVGLPGAVVVGAGWLSLVLPGL